MFTGLSAFPLTPITASGVDEQGFIKILARLTAAHVDSMGILGSTGSYAYLTREQRKRIAILAKQHAGDIPMMVCVGAVSTDAILHLADDAQASGANALLLPVTCSPLFIQNAVSNVRRSLKADITTLLLHIVCPKQ